MRSEDRRHDARDVELRQRLADRVPRRRHSHHHQRKQQTAHERGITELEATAGIEPADEGFADLCLTTWLRRLAGRGSECSERPKERQYSTTFDILSGPRTAPAAAGERLAEDVETEQQHHREEPKGKRLVQLSL